MPRTPYPQLRSSAPVIWRTDDEIQVGLGTGAVLLAVPPGLRIDPARVLQLLTLLTGERPLAAIAQQIGITVAYAQRVVRALDHAGLLVTPDGSLSGQTIKVIGAGLLGSRLTDLLLAHDPRAILVADDDPADPRIHPRSPPGSSNAQALAARLDRTQVQVLAHWTKPDGSIPDLTVVATDTAECDRAVTDTLVRDDQPHLLLRGLDDGAIVGPFVHPGNGSCVRCGDLHRRDRDPAWPRLLQQLSRVPGAPSALAVEWGATTAAIQVLAWAAGRRPEVWEATLELSARDWLTRLRAWPRHPQCGCAGLAAG